MSKHTPWTQEQAEKWAMESDVIRKATFEDDAIEGFKAGMAKAAAEFERIVAELRAEVAQLKVELGRPYDKVDRLFEANKKHLETIATQARVIEKLKTYAKHRVDCICRAGVLQYSEECDCGLDAIEMGEA